VNLDIYNSASSGNLYVVAVLITGQLQLFWRRTTGTGVSGATVNTTWIPTEIFGSGIGASPPVMIQDFWRTNDETTPGGFQLLVAVNGRVQHWQRVNTNINTNPPREGGGRGSWGLVKTFGSGNIKAVWGLVQGSFRGALDAVVEDNNGNMWHWRYGGSPGDWTVQASVPGVKGG
jgi:hypothetical protein